MIPFTLQSTNRQYDLDRTESRIVMREDLDQLGFFTVDGYNKYWTWFEQPMMPFAMISEMLWSIRLFDSSVIDDPERVIN